MCCYRYRPHSCKDILYLSLEEFSENGVLGRIYSDQYWQAYLARNCFGQSNSYVLEKWFSVGVCILFFIANSRLTLWLISLTPVLYMALNLCSQLSRLVHNGWFMDDVAAKGHNTIKVSGDSWILRSYLHTQHSTTLFVFSSCFYRSLQCYG